MSEDPEEPPAWLSRSLPSERPERIRMVRELLEDYAKFQVRSLTDVEYIAWRMGIPMRDARRLVQEVSEAYD